MKIPHTEIDEILNSLDGISRAEARPYMHTRIMARLEEENTFWGRAVSLVAQPVFAFACLSLVLVANVYTIFNSGYEQQETATNSSNTVTDVLQNDNYVLAANYNSPY